MAKKGDYYIVEVLQSHISWGTYRNPTNRKLIDGESYVKIPAKYARDYGIVRNMEYIAYFDNDFGPIRIQASGNGPFEDGIQFAKQFEGIGFGACKAFTPWYVSSDIKVGDKIKVLFLSDNEILFIKYSEKQ